MNPERTTAAPAPKSASWYKRLFATMIARESDSERHYYDDRKRALLGPLRGDVLEIGPGSGSNLPYFSPDVRWTGIEPNPAMFPYIQREATRLGLAIHLREGQAEQLDAADSSIDAVVGTLVLCSVRDPEHTLQEVLRVLRPGGRFVFIEHVAAPLETGLRRLQGFVRPVWKIASDGCHPDRETWSIIEQAGFDHVQLEHFRLAVPIVGPHIAGFAVK
ncbi:MAG TPA: class I SAM-dependent methyltransferase [Aggregatilineales bacterium]|nr:class I SAM-dependent methyltransferase [Aggregatilineales bacterium]